MTANYCRKYSLQSTQVKWNHHCIPRLGHIKARTDWKSYGTTFLLSWAGGEHQTAPKTSLHEITQRSCSALVSPTFLFTGNLAMQYKPAGGSKSLASLKCCPFFALSGSSGACLHAPAFLTSLALLAPPAARMICLEQSASLWLLGSLCSFPILMTWGLLKPEAKSRQKHFWQPAKQSWFNLRDIKD